MRSIDIQRMTWLALSVLLFGVGLLVVGPFLVPVPALTDTKPASELADPDSKFFETGGLSIHYKETGEGSRNLILLHGFGASLFSWREVMDPLSTIGRVVAYDRPAFGLTSRPMPGEWQGLNPYSGDAQVEILIELMDGLGIRKAALVAHSAGASVAVQAALEHPDRIESLVLVAPALYARSSRYPAWLAPILSLPQMRRLGPLFVRSIAESGNDTILRSWYDPDKVTDGIIDGYRKPLGVDNWDRALYEFTLAARSTGLVDRLDELVVPVLVVSGTEDRIVPVENSIRVAGGIAASKLVTIPRCGHLPHEECVLDFLQAVEEFLVQGQKVAAGTPE